MTCMRIPGGFICTGISGDPMTCRELVDSRGRACLKCPAKGCMMRRKSEAEVYKAYQEMRKEKKL